MLITFAEWFRDALVLFLIAGTSLLLLLFLVLVVQRLLVTAADRRRERLSTRHQPLIDDAIASGAEPALDTAATVPMRHHDVVSQVILARLRLVRGEERGRAAILADRLTLTRRWRRDLSSRRWWRRAEAALALGLIRDETSVSALHDRLDDRHEQVRAAAIDALGEIGDPESVPLLLARMADPTRYERARLVQSLREYGEGAVDALLAHGAANPSQRALVAQILSFIGGAAAEERLLEWSTAADDETRESAWQALARIGLTDRAFARAVDALGTGTPPVRAAVARALARTGRADAAPHLAARLDDEWQVAAQAARGLARLGPDGTAALQTRIAQGPGLGHDLAQQLLWERGLL